MCNNSIYPHFNIRGKRANSSSKRQCWHYLLCYLLIALGGAPAYAEFSSLAGRYQGAFKNTAYKVWIEPIAATTQPNQPFALVLIFEQSRSAQIKQQLAQPYATYAQAVCDYLQQHPRQSPYPELVGTHGVWDDAGGLGLLIMPHTRNSANRFELRTRFYIDLPRDDQHGLQYLYTDADGQAVQIRLTETGYVQKPWSYFLPGPSIELEKIASDVAGSLARYYQNIEQLSAHFERARQNNRMACDVAVLE